ncbi:MAG: hypothetical protein AAF696_26675 [Bacteroidota bacterium]
MTIEQREAQILSLVGKLPILRRIRLALTILKGVEPNQIPIQEEQEDLHINHPDYIEEEQLAQRLMDRKASYLKGEGKNLSTQELINKIYQEISTES